MARSASLIVYAEAPVVSLHSCINRPEPVASQYGGRNKSLKGINLAMTLCTICDRAEALNLKVESMIGAGICGAKDSLVYLNIPGTIMNKAFIASRSDEIEDQGEIAMWCRFV